jgi:hypothetical protein
MQPPPFPSLPEGEDLKALSARSGVPVARLARLWKGTRATYFDALLIEHATMGRITPDHFRSNARSVSTKQGTLLHGELVWGSKLGRKLALIIIESGLRPKEWCLHNEIRAETIYTMLMNGRIPRAELAIRLVEATRTAGSQAITLHDLYDHHVAHRARSVRGVA